MKRSIAINFREFRGHEASSSSKSGSRDAANESFLSALASTKEALTSHRNLLQAIIYYNQEIHKCPAEQRQYRIGQTVMLQQAQEVALETSGTGPSRFLLDLSFRDITDMIGSDRVFSLSQRFNYLEK